MRLGLIGFGNIATRVLGDLPAIAAQPLEHVRVLCRPGVVDATNSQLHSKFANVATRVDAVGTVDELLALKPDLVIECAGHAAVSAFGPPVLQASVDLIVASMGALSDDELHQRLIAAATTGKSRMILPPARLAVWTS